MTHHQNPQPVIVVNNNASVPQWITAGCSVATLGIVAYTAMSVLDKVNQVNETVEAVKNPVKTIKSRFRKES